LLALLQPSNDFRLSRRRGAGADSDPPPGCHNHLRATKAVKPSARCALLFGAGDLRTAPVRLR
jgi:hypothetical protein